jgi:type III secretion protein J
MKSKASFLALCLALAFTLSACSEQELYGQLTERQANEMVAVLRSTGMDAQKLSKDNGQFALAVAKDDFSQAVEVLRANGYPRDGHDSLGQVFKKEGFVSTPLEERARLTHALSEEIANTIGNIDGVIMARVHLSLPEKDPLADKAPPSAASVFIKYRVGVDLNPHIGQIKALVVNAIQGMSYDNVTVALFPSEPWPQHQAREEGRLGPVGRALGWLALSGLALAVLGGGGWLWWRQQGLGRARASGRTAIQKVLT